MGVVRGQGLETCPLKSQFFWTPSLSNMTFFRFCLFVQSYIILTSNSSTFPVRFSDCTDVIRVVHICLSRICELLISNIFLAGILSTIFAFLFQTLFYLMIFLWTYTNISYENYNEEFLIRYWLKLLMQIETLKWKESTLNLRRTEFVKSVWFSELYWEKTFSKQSQNHQGDDSQK